MLTRDHCITREAGRLFFTINGQTIPADRVRCLEPARLAALCEMANAQFDRHPTLKFIALRGSITEPAPDNRQVRLFPTGLGLKGLANEQAVAPLRRRVQALRRPLARS